MTITTRLLLLFSMLVATSSSLFAKTWHGIEPLRSTRSDVIRVLNQCSDQKEACVFALGDEDVFILFSGGLSETYGDCATKLPAETVMFIESRPRSVTTLQDYGFSKGDFTQFNPAAPLKIGYQSYLNLKDGLGLKSYKGNVVQIVYLPSASEVPRCASYYNDPEFFVGVYLGHVPFVTIKCPKGPVFEGQQLVVSASSDFNSKRFDWTVSVGRIVAGQHTQRIIVDSTGLAGQQIKVEGEANVYDLGNRFRPERRSLTAYSSCEVPVLKKP